jgi:hypothetical protein
MVENLRCLYLWVPKTCRTIKFTEILVGPPIGIWHWPTSRPMTKSLCNPFPSPNGKGELCCMVSQLAFSYP